MLQRPRGLTLLETLLAAAILAMMAAAVVPTIARAMALLRNVDRPHATQIADLALAADGFMRSPERYGFARDELHLIDRVVLVWPTIEGLENAIDGWEVVIRAVRADAASDDEPMIDHCWLTFECDGLVIVRHVPVPEKPERGEREVAR